MRWRSSPASASASASACLLVAREAVEQEAVARVAAGDPVGDHADDHLVGHELAGVHEPLCLPAQLGALGHLRAQDVAGGDVRQLKVLAQAVGLRALAGAGRTEQDQVELGQDRGSLPARVGLVRAVGAFLQYQSKACAPREAGAT